MKKLLLLSSLAFALTAASGFAQTSGTFGYGLILTGNGTLATNPGAEILYGVSNGSDGRLTPIDAGAVTGALPNQVSTWENSSTAAAPTFDLGTFTTSDTLILDGGSFLTYQNSGVTVSGVDLNYRITAGTSGASGAYTAEGLALNQSNVTNPGDERWASNTMNINLLQGLAPGTYTLSTYGNASNGGSGLFESNNGADFGAKFTVVAVPEPSTWAMMIGGLGALVLFSVRRRQLVG